MTLKNYLLFVAEHVEAAERKGNHWEVASLLRVLLETVQQKLNDYYTAFPEARE